MVAEAWEPVGESTWTVAMVRQALDDHERGIMRDSAQMVDAMGRDDRVSSVLSTLTSGVVGLPFSVVPASRSRAAARVARVVDAAWYEMAPESEVRALLHWSRTLGVGVAQVVTDAGGLPRLRSWHPQHIEMRHPGRIVAYTTRGEVDVVPGRGWVVHMPYGPRSWMRGSVRAIAIPWLIRQFSIRDWARHNEVHAMPIRKAIVPSDASPSDTRAFYRSIRSLGSETTIKLPRDADGRGFDLQLLEAEHPAHETFERLIAACNVSISVEVLGQSLRSEVQGGSYVSDRVHERIRIDYLEAEAESLTTTLHQQLVRPWVEREVGDASLAPWPVWDAEPIADHRAEAQTLESVGRALAALDPVLRASGRALDLDHLAETYGLRLVEVPVAQPAPVQSEPAQPAEERAA